MNFLNLIPQNQKERLKRERIFLLMHSIIGLLVVVVAIGAILLITARFTLVNYYSKIKHDTSLVNSDLLRLQSNVGKLNNQIEDAAKIQTTFTKTSALLQDMLKLFGEGITIDFFNINIESRSFRVTGTAQNRDSLLLAKEALKNSGIVVELESPLSNFLEKEQITFRFSGKLAAGIYQSSNP